MGPAAPLSIYVRAVAGIDLVFGATDHCRDINAEREMLLDAVLKGDVPRATTLLIAHCRTTADIVLGESREA